MSDGFTFRLDPETFEALVAAVADGLREESPEHQEDGNGPEWMTLPSPPSTSARRSRRRGSCTSAERCRTTRTAPARRSGYGGRSWTPIWRQIVTERLLWGHAR
jgi:hypothetical protein